MTPAEASGREANSVRQNIEKLLCVFMENCSFYITIVIGAYCLVVLPEIYRFHAQAKASSSPFVYSELLIVVVGLVASAGLYFLTPGLFGNYVSKNLAETQYRREGNAARQARMLNYIHGMVYYPLSFTAGLVLTKGSDLRPKLFGGRFNGMEFVNIWPQDIPDPLRWYFLFQLGHHIERALVLVIYKRKTNDFFTMNLHHLLTILLMLYSYLMRQLFWGIPVVLIHDMSDSLLNATKFFREIKPLKRLLSPTFAAFWASWLFTRVFVYTIEILGPLKYILIHPSEAINAYFYTTLFQVVCLHMLGVLNYYWSFMLTKMLYNKLTAKSEKNAMDGE